MKKVAIMTWYSYFNYGSVLQAAALYKKVADLADRVDVIRYEPEVSVPYYTSLGVRKIAEKLVSKIRYRKSKLYCSEGQKKKYQIFIRERLTFTEECIVASDLFRLNDEYDIFLCGSDQIWSPLCFDPKYYLDFVQGDKKKISYAPSLGVTSWDEKEIKCKIKSLVEDFDYLSVREEEGRKLIEEAAGVKAEVTLDPTLLLSEKEWREFEEKVDVEESYALCYFLGNNPVHERAAQRMADMLGLSVRFIPVYRRKNERGLRMEDVGPGEFLYLLRHAKFVFTDSFHGTAFAINFGIPFLVFERFGVKERKNQNSRIHNLLRLTGMEDRLYKKREKYDADRLRRCGFKEARKRLEAERVSSLCFLRSSVNGEGKKQKAAFRITNTCYGCGACSAVCPVQAVKLIDSGKGFLEASVDSQRCIGCGKCRSVCPFYGEKPSGFSMEKDKLFMFKGPEDILKVSSSGGAAYSLYAHMMEQGYLAAGCIYDRKRGETRHIVVREDEKERLRLFQGSKYMKSRTEEIYRWLNSHVGKAVFVGTPCQVAAMSKMLGERRNDYLLVDLICHGTPSDLLWKKYMGEINQYTGEKPEVIFRDKARGWRKRFMRITGDTNMYVKDEKRDFFYRNFVLSTCSSPACYECPYRGGSYADIRLGDYWGERFKHDRTGVSMVIAHTEKGLEILKSLDGGTKAEYPIEDFYQIQGTKNIRQPYFYNEILDDLRNDNVTLKAICDKYCRPIEKRIYIAGAYSKLKRIFTRVAKY